MRAERKSVLCIAGFDPSGGAGVLADIKTCEANKVYGLGVITANTFQNDETFEGMDWIPVEKILAQVDVLKKRFEPEYVKIGLVENGDVLLKIIMHLKTILPEVKIIWDPIVKASSGFQFHKDLNGEATEKIATQLYLITPNYHEALLLGKGNSAENNCVHVAKWCHVFLKGGHNEKKPGYDILYMKSGKNFSFRPKEKKIFAKHGSGCVLSSAIAANLAKGEDLHRACLKAKQYTEYFLKSNKTLSGYHKI